MGFCETLKMVAWTRPDADENVLLARLRCKMWSCDYCAGQNQRIWRAFLLKRLPEVSAYWRLMTLTAHEDDRTQAGSLANIRTNIDRLMKRMRRSFGKISYVRVFEPHQNNAVHAHFIVSGLPDRVTRRRNKQGTVIFSRAKAVSSEKTWGILTYLKHTCRALGMGYMADISPLVSSHDKAVFYITKYLTKAQSLIECRNLRRVQTTRDIGSPKPESEYFWRAEPFITARDFHPGDVIYDITAGVYLEAEYWSEHDTYPPPAK